MMTWKYFFWWLNLVGVFLTHRLMAIFCTDAGHFAQPPCIFRHQFFLWRKCGTFRIFRDCNFHAAFDLHFFSQLLLMARSLLKNHLLPSVMLISQCSFGNPILGVDLASGIAITATELEVTDLTHIFETGTWWEPHENQDGVFSTSQDAPKPFHLLCKKSPYCLSNHQVAEIHWADSFDRLPPRCPTTRTLMKGQLEASLKEGYGNAEMYEHTCMYITVYLSIHTHISHCRTLHPSNAPRVPLVLVLVLVVVVVAVQNTLPGLKDLKHGDDWNPTHCKGILRGLKIFRGFSTSQHGDALGIDMGVRSSILSGQSTRIALIELRAILHTTIHFWSPLGVPGHGSS